MERRRYLLAVASLAGVAGCGGGGTSAGPDGRNATSQSTTPARRGPTATETPTPTPTEPAFAVESLDMPAKVGAGEPFSWSLTVANRGDGDGVFRTVVSSKRGDGAFERLGEIELEIAAGETETFESERGRLPYLGTVTFRFDGLDRRPEVAVTPRSLQFYEEYRSPASVVTAANGLRLRDAYTYETNSGGVEAVVASEGEKWAFLDFEATNRSDATAVAPRVTDLALVSGDTQYDSVYVLKQSGQYRGGEIASGITRRGWVAYTVPADLTVDDFVVAYSAENDEGEWAVRWRADGGDGG